MLVSSKQFLGLDQPKNQMNVDQHKYQNHEDLDWYRGKKKPQQCSKNCKTKWNTKIRRENKTKSLNATIKKEDVIVKGIAII